MLVLCLLVFSGFAQKVNNKDSVPKKMIYIEHADTLSFDKEGLVDAQLLLGNVVFRHDSSYMFCDSAYFYELSNTLEAFGDVRLEQGDTLFIYGNYLHYNGNTQLARIRNNVRMLNRDVTLFTDSLNYDRLADLGYYFEGGMIVDAENELSSYDGKYSPGTQLAIFNDSVVLENPQFTLFSDTLHYNAGTKVVTILGPSTILSDSATVYSSFGWYDTQKNISMLLNRSRIVSGSKILEGDSVAFDRTQGIGEAFGNMFIRDTLEHIELTGEYGYYNEKTEYAFATDEAMMVEASTQDTLYLHADSISLVTLDSAYREMKAYYGVRFFREDIQGVCDSMVYSTQDSVLCMYNNPVLWNQSYQLNGDTIYIYPNDTTLDFVHVKEYAFAIQEVDTTYYNQMKGNDLKAFFEEGALREILIEGNAESIFYPAEEGGEFVGKNDTKSGFLSILIKENKLERLKVWPSPQGSMTPIPDIKPDSKLLKDFKWFDYLRPKDKADIFTKIKRTEADSPKRSSKFVR
jgi:lipopolysaccharide export system protein LptA